MCIIKVHSSLRCFCIALYTMSEHPLDQGTHTLVIFILSTQQSWNWETPANHEGVQYNHVRFHVPQQNWMQRPYGSYFQISLWLWLPQLWILWPRTSKIQGPEGCSVLVAAVCYMPYNACATNSKSITTNMLPITRMLWIWSASREKGCWEEMWGRRVLLMSETQWENIGCVWITNRTFSACFSTESLY